MNTRRKQICYLEIYLKSYFGETNLNFLPIDFKNSDVLKIKNKNILDAKEIFVRINLSNRTYFASLDKENVLDLENKNSVNEINLDELVEVIAITLRLEKKKYNSSSVHVLNGDVLLNRFPKNIQGEKITMRECLIDGELVYGDIEFFFEVRSAFIFGNHWISEEREYYNKLVSELLYLKNINSNAVIYLWFEEDLFCQVNMWFICHFLFTIKCKNEIKVVRPLSHAPYSFGQHSDEQLLSIYTNTIPLGDLSLFDKLWQAYVNNQKDDLMKIKGILPKGLGFISTAIDAELHRNEVDSDGIDNLTKDVKLICTNIETLSFELAFQEFGKLYPEYGLGDLQFKKIYESINR